MGDEERPGEDPVERHLRECFGDAPKRDEPPSSEILRRLRSKSGRPRRYLLQGEVARGGMGAILKVWDEDLRRHLAMKVVLGPERGEAPQPAEAIDARRLGRFLEEAQVTGQLEHPGIVPVHELGLDETGRVYFTMRLVQGRDLADVFALARAGHPDWNRTRVLGLLQRACEAMAFAHSKGVIHRDLKPSNVMVGGFGELYVMDWGLARVAGEEDAHDLRLRGADEPAPVESELREASGKGPSDVLYTMDGDVLGTPAYMSPEQARGEVAELDARTDVYAMGAMLYHLLAEHPPFLDPGSQATAHEVLNRLLEGEPEPLAQAAPEAPAELVAICEKAMARDKDARYPDMSELAADLRAFLEHRVVAAYATGAVAEFKKWVERNRGLAASIAAAILLTLLGLGSTAWVQKRANEDLAEINADLKEARDLAVQNEEQAVVQRERAELESATSEQVVRFLTGMFEQSQPERTRGETITVKEVLDSAARDLEPELAEQPEIRARLAASMGELYRGLGLYAEALPLFDGAAALDVELYGASSGAAFASRLRLAELRVDLGQYDEADPVLRELAQAGGAEIAPAALVALARAEKDRARLAEAALHLDRAIESYRAAGQGDGPEALRAESVRIDLAREKRSFEELEAGRLELVARARAALGPEHETTLELEVELAELERGFARYAAAEERLGRVLELRRRVLGPEHPATLATAEVLANVFRGQGRVREAIELSEEGLAAAREVLGARHHDVLIIQNKLADLYSAAGRYDDSAALFEATLQGFALAFGEHHPGTAATLNNLGLLEQRRARFAEAQTAFERALEIRRELYGEASHPALQTLNNLALCYRMQGRPAEALPIFEELVEGFRQIFGASHPESITVLDNWGVTFYALRRFEEALAVFEEEVDLSSGALGEAHPLVARVRNNLGATLLELDRPEEALEQHERALAAREAAFGPEHPDTLASLGHIARILLESGETAKAEAYVERMHGGTRRSFGPEHPRTLSAEAMLGSVHYANQRFEAAEASFRRASDGLAKVYPASHDAVLQSRLHLAECLERLGRDAEAREVAAPLLELLPEGDPRREPLDRLMERLGS